jgi:predicted phosphodiesterase
VRYLIVSDIHGNWEALEAVLERARNSYDQVVCLGDVVGYGPDPNRVVEWVRANALTTIRGNHDRASVGLEDLEWFNPVARAAALWTQNELTPENREWVRALPKGPAQIDSFQIVHGSPLDEDGYVVNATEASFVFPYVSCDLTFFGHSHLQGGFVWSKQRVRSLQKPRVLFGVEALDLEADCQYLVNPGSVGQPRDLDPRAAFVIYDGRKRSVHYHREPYDISKTQTKIRAAGLPDLLADRLALGR